MGCEELKGRKEVGGHLNFAKIEKLFVPLMDRFTINN